VSVEGHEVQKVPRVHNLGKILCLFGEPQVPYYKDLVQEFFPDPLRW